MNLNDFRMWLTGFAESVNEAPTPSQWKRIMEVLASVPGGGIGLTPPVSIPTVWVDPSRGVGGGTGSPLPQWGQSTCQSPGAAGDTMLFGSKN